MSKLDSEAVIQLTAIARKFACIERFRAVAVELERQFDTTGRLICDGKLRER